MIVKSMNESAICAIGHAFGYYDYGEETGMVYAFFGQEPTAQYICAYVCGMLRGGFLHTTSERGEGYIAYKRPKEKLGFKTLWPIATGMLHNSSMKRLMRFAMAIKKGGKSLQERMDKEKKPYIFTPLFAPVALQLGIDPIHLGTVMIVNLAIGLFTPPVGVNLYVACGIGDIKIEEITKGIIPCLLAELVVLLLITYIPDLSLMFVG